MLQKMILNQNQNHTVANDFKSKSFKIDLQNQNHADLHVL